MARCRHPHDQSLGTVPQPSVRIPSLMLLHTNVFPGTRVSIVLSVLLVLEVAAQFAAITTKLARTSCKPLVAMTHQSSLINV